MVSQLGKLRAWRHRRRWARKNLRRMLDSDAVLISHTKSGRTWLRVMISHVYHLTYGIGSRQLINADNFHAINPAIPKLFFFRDTAMPTFRLNGGAVNIPREKKCLFFVRDPRDVAVSFYFHIRNRATERELDRKGIAGSARALPLEDFIMDPDLGVARVVEHYNRWRRELECRPQTLLVRYEDMRSDPGAVLARSLAFIDRPYPPDVLSSAVEFATFENLSRKESQGYFDSEKLGAADAGDADSMKVRRGKVGGYRDYFNEARISAMDALVRDHLDPLFGYR